VSALPSNLAAGLLKFLEPERAPEPRRKRGRPKSAPEPRRKRGRPKAHGNGQKLGRLLKAVAEIHSKNKTRRGGLSIARALKKKPEYAALSERTLRRRVKCVLDWEMNLLKRIPTDLWEELLGISPPQGATTEKALGEKAFELLRHQLREHELLAKKQ
jgi:hypothetical protein